MKIECKVEYKDGNVVITVPYNGDPSAFPVSSTGKSRLIASARYVECENTPDPNLLVSVGLLSTISRQGR